MKYEGNLVQVCTNLSKHTMIFKETKELKILDDLRIDDLLNLVLKLSERVDTLTDKYNDLVAKYNVLQAAYKANAAKTAMQLLDLEENK